jgi:hypothetical protein
MRCGRALSPDPFHHCLGASAYDRASKFVNSVRDWREFERFPIDFGDTFRGRLFLPVANDLEDAKNRTMAIAMAGDAVVVSLP